MTILPPNDLPPTASRLHPVKAKIKERYPLSKNGSTKHTHHVVLDLTDAPIDFKVGDSIGIYPENDPILVHHLIEAMKADPQEIIQESRSGQKMTLKSFLTFKANLSRLTSSFLKLFYECETVHDKKNHLHRLLQQENKPLLKEYLTSHDPLDLLKEYKEVKAPLQQLCDQFGPLLPRFYSVASSKLSHPNEVHLTVALFTFSHQGEKRYGVGTHFLCQLATPNKTSISLYVQPAHHFTLPPNDNAPIIMVGPGTGIAPFRAFLQERMMRGASGKNWLFFGERNRAYDYFYEEELEELKAKGKLRLDLAFSRDQEEKIYVQHRMQQQSKDLFATLQEGAYFYVCGDAHHMAKDVEHALQKIIEKEGRMSEEAAKAYVKSMRTHKRYLTDVY